MFTKKKVWIALDVSLGLVAIILFVNLFGVNIPSIGNATATLTSGDPVCLYEYEQEFNLAPVLERCCFEAVKRVNEHQTSQFTDKGHLTWVYYNNHGQGNIWMNNKAKVECEQLEFWIKK
jgi:hypothetical protein